MRVTFMAFAEDSIIHAELLLPGERLSDFIADDGMFEIEHVTVEALDDGRTIQVDRTSIARDDLVAITAAGPRGDKARRVRTRPHASRMQAGPYEIVGYVHAPPSAHPFGDVSRRRVLPVTSAGIRYRVLGQTTELAFDALLVNPSKIDWLEPATDNDVRLCRALEIPCRIDSHAKDLTGELLVGRAQGLN
jgi:hypothetical protein